MRTNTPRIGRVATFTTLLLAPAVLLAQPAGGKGKAKAAIDLVSSVESVVPGAPFDIGIRFVIDPGWHTYWQNSGESGLPPKAKWILPDGFAIGELRFPVPERHYDPGPIVTNILEGKPVLQATITPPAAIRAKKVTIATDLTYFVCAKQCIRDTVHLKLELPVSPPGTAAKPANEELFSRARAALPHSSSDHVSISAVTKPADLVPGKPFEYLVTVHVADGFMIPAPKPGVSGLTGVDLFVHSVPGLYYDETKFPEGKARSLGSHGTVNTLSGSFTIRVVGEVDSDATGPFRLGGVLVFQACEEGGTCLPVEAVAFPSGASAAGSAATTGAAQGPTGSAEVPSPIGTVDQSGGVGGALRRFGFVGLLVACFIYGLFINATPCVLPLLSIKVLGFVQQAHQSRSRTLALGLAFGVGVMVFFVVLGFLAARGSNILQYNAAIIGLGGVVLALALSMLGVYTLQVPTAATQLEASLQKEGLASSFGKGALAPVLGFACTGPLLAGAFGWATQQPAHIAFFAFLSAGFGMAFPYMLLGANPQWLSFLPKPGNWMITFERVMGFLLLGMVIWLVHPLVHRLGATALEWTLVFYVAIALACWVFGQVDFSMSTARRWVYRGSSVAFIIVVGGLIYEVIYPLDEAREAMARAQAPRPTVKADDNGPWCPYDYTLWDPKIFASDICDAKSGTINFEELYKELCRANFEAAWKNGIPWNRWSQDEVKRAVEEGWIAFVDFTADTCTVCKSNKLIATNTEEVRQRMKELGVVPFQGDNSTRNDKITAMLHKYDRLGVPLNLIYPAHRPDQPIVLEPNLTKQYLLEKLQEAAAAGSDTPSVQQTSVRASQPGIP